MIDMFKTFVVDKHEMFMYITGAAGTGKSTSLKKLVNYCLKNSINYRVCAFTHKACEVLEDKIQVNNDKIVTLHSLLGKIPGINKEAKNINNADTTFKMNKRYDFDVVFIDEYSMIGEKDYVDIVAISEDYNIKVVWIGDPNQLPPVKDIQSVIPSGPYQYVLTKVYRNDNPLQQPLQALISYINGKRPEPLKAIAGYFERGKNLVEEYKPNDILLCFTNKAVQHYNKQINEKYPSNLVYSALTKKEYILDNNAKFIQYCSHNDTPIHNDKYNTLDKLLDKYDTILTKGGIKYFIVFGTNNFLETKKLLKQNAVKTNLAISDKYKIDNVHEYCIANKSDKLVKQRNAAWSEYLNFEQHVLQIDYNHAMTVHKSQGSTYDRVLVDMKDIAKCSSLQLQLQLTYVAISRAKKCVITN